LFFVLRGGFRDAVYWLLALGFRLLAVFVLQREACGLRPVFALGFRLWALGFRLLAVFVLKREACGLRPVFALDFRL
jgi:hypothetical protein